MWSCSRCYSHSQKRSSDRKKDPQTYVKPFFILQAYRNTYEHAIIHPQYVDSSHFGSIMTLRIMMMMEIMVMRMMMMVFFPPIYVVQQGDPGSEASIKLIRPSTCTKMQPLS